MASFKQRKKTRAIKRIQTIDFIEDFMRWSRRRKEIRAVALAGSYAREEMDIGTDVDLVIIAEKPEEYLSDKSWTKVFGVPITMSVEDHGKLKSLRVWYESGLEVEYGFTTRDWIKFPLAENTKHIIQDGLRVLFEKEKLLSPHETPASKYKSN